MSTLTRQSIPHYIQQNTSAPKISTTNTSTTASKSSKSPRLFRRSNSVPLPPSSSSKNSTPFLFPYRNNTFPKSHNNHSINTTRLSSSSDRSEEDASDSKNAAFLPFGPKYPDFSIKTQCPHCNKYVRTIVQHENGTCVYVLASGLFLTTVVLFWVPFFVDAVKDVKHSCPNCQNYLGTRHRLKIIS
ncbi:5258_t:CDS:2 [Ambispora gerdemannii]|uniref:5258_t:CDS:1 n=1 Tax=Ambispora gerdemannii TaxID=144530 RepID=A0A9N9DK29_9GLOM|nr:5258_t:CDS:2 [Ambispora gerdemannii]